MNIEPDLLEGEVALKELGVELGHKEQVLFEEGPHRVAESVGDEAELKVEVQGHEVLHGVVVRAEWQDLVHQIEQ